MIKNEADDKIIITVPDIAVQYGLGSATDGGHLTNIWVETTKPENCNLACSYCYANGGERQAEQSKSLSLDDWITVLEQAKNAGVNSIGIPGAGEPFHPGAIDRTMQILDKCKELGMYVTVFTTGQFITEELADRLLEMPVELMIKGNSLLTNVQDAFVSDPNRNRHILGYGLARNKTLELLIAKGFNDSVKCQEQYGRKSRLALVTSVMTENISSEQETPTMLNQIRKFVDLMNQYTSLGITNAYKKAIEETSKITFSGTSNYGEIAYLLAFCRVNNIIFDVDSILKHGRGESCCLDPEDMKMKAKFKELQAIDKDVFGYDWGINTTYVGVACDRPRRHLYINHEGEMRPCIGASGVKLGNIRAVDLIQAWNSQEMKLIRAKKYAGKCADSCANYVEIDKRTGNPLCNSCLGRSTENLTNESLLSRGSVQTTGCWNYRPRSKGQR